MSKNVDRFSAINTGMDSFVFIYKRAGFLPFPLLPLPLVFQLFLFVSFVIFQAFPCMAGLTPGMPFDPSDAPGKLMNIFFQPAFRADSSRHGLTPAAALFRHFLAIGLRS